MGRHQDLVVICRKSPHQSLTLLVYPEPVNVILFGKRVLTNIIKDHNRRLSWFRVDSSKELSLEEKERGHTAEKLR